MMNKVKDSLFSARFYYFYSINSRLGICQKLDVPSCHRGTLSTLFSFPVKGRQDFRETRLLIGGADGNALKARNAWGIDHRLGPVPRWDLCWKSFVYLRAIYCGWREEYKEQERAQVRERYSNELILKVQTTDTRRVSTIYNTVL